MLIVRIIVFITLSVSFSRSSLQSRVDHDYERLRMVELFGIGSSASFKSHQHSLGNSASKFLLEMYEELRHEEEYKSKDVVGRRRKRTLNSDDNFITELDRLETSKCNNVITFSSKRTTTPHHLDADDDDMTLASMQIAFNTNDVPVELQLVQAVLRIYQNPAPCRHWHCQQSRNITVSVYGRSYAGQRQPHNMHASLNISTSYRGWLELNITEVLAEWLAHRTFRSLFYGNELLVGYRTTIRRTNAEDDIDMHIEDAAPVADLQPFIIGYFNGPGLMAKIENVRKRRDVTNSVRGQPNARQWPHVAATDIYRMPKSCERLNFTLDFKDLQMHDWVIAPSKFDAFICSGECNFPLSTNMNATNHAIVQTLMHLKQPHLPKASCVPTVLGSISLLHYLNEDSVNLSKYPQSVAKECGCH